MSTILLDKRTDPPFVAMRNRRADQYIPRVQEGIKGIFDRAVEQVATFAEYGIREAYTAGLQAQMEAALYVFQRPYILTMVTDGYTLASTMLTTKSFTDKLWAKQYEDVPEAITGRRGNIEEWLTQTAKREAREHAKKIKEIHDNAQTYWDDKLKRGLTPKEIAKEILVKGYAYDTNYANLISRTNTIWSMNEGAEIKYLEAGVTRERWLTTDDDVRCVYCLEMQGAEIGIKDVFLPEGGRIQHPEIPERFLEVPFAVSHPPLHPYCVLGDTMITASDIKAAFVSDYAGLLVEITTVDGRCITVTENHLFPTVRGFVRAKELNGSDYIFDCSKLQRIIGRYIDQDRVPARIDKIVEAFAHTHKHSSSIPSTADFHGDGAFMNGEIDIIAPDSFLSGNGESTSYEKAIRELFVSGNISESLFDSLSPFNQLLLRAACTFDCVMSSDNVPGVFLRGTFAHHQSIGGGTISNNYTTLPQISADDVTGNIEMFSDSVLGLTGLITPTHVTAVKFDSVHKDSPVKVYDLQTDTSLYIANGILSSNCRCTIVPVVETISIPARG